MSLRASGRRIGTDKFLGETPDRPNGELVKGKGGSSMKSTCWTCGKAGHRQEICRSKKDNPSGLDLVNKLCTF